MLLFFYCICSVNVSAKNIAYESEDGNFILYKIDGSETCLARKNLKVYQATGTSALVCEVNDSSCEYFGENLMYIWSDLDNHYYYDGEIIPNPVGKCAKQIGVYRYETIAKYNDGSSRYRTVPVISILRK